MVVAWNSVANNAAFYQLIYETQTAFGKRNEPGPTG